MTFCPKCGAQVPETAGFCPSCGSPLGGASSQTPVTGLSTLSRDAGAQQYWTRRLFAFVIDAVIVYAVIGILVAAAALPAFLAGIFVPGYSPYVFPFGTFFGTFASLLLVLYFAVAESTYGKTIGKGVMGLRVTRDGGGNPNFGTSFLRNLSKINGVLLLLDVILGLALETGYTRKFSDKYLGTSVTHA